MDAALKSWESKVPPPPGQLRFPPRNCRPYEGTINDWFPLIRPAIRALFPGGGSFGGGYLRFP